MHVHVRTATAAPQTTGTARAVVRKKAALCLLRLMRKTPADAQLVTPDTFAPIMSQLLEERDLGLLLCCVTLLLGICGRSGSSGEPGREWCVVRAHGVRVARVRKAPAAADCWTVPHAAA